MLKGMEWSRREQVPTDGTLEGLGVLVDAELDRVDGMLFTATPREDLEELARTQRLKDDDIHRLFDATRDSLVDWTNHLRAETKGNFPEKVTAFREGMAVHGRYGQPCPRCGAKIQRIRYASNETNYCPECQTGGKLLADRGLSRLLKEDWPRTLEELEALKRR